MGGHPTPLSTCQRDPLTDLRHLWVEGPTQPLEIPSLKPTRICSSQCRGRAGLGSAFAVHPTFCERFASPSGTEMSFAPLFCGLYCSRILCEFLFTDVLWVVGSDLCVCVSFYSAILALPSGIF